MSAHKLRKYLAYYRKILRDDPENIEARLRLAALFREMERPSHAVEEYGMAAKLLASEGLPLEAIAACKAILELDPSHQETQFFLARLYARVPEATGDSVRVAKPVPATCEGGGWSQEQSGTSIQSLEYVELEEAAIILESPKKSGKPARATVEEHPGDEEVTSFLAPQARESLLRAIEDDEEAFEIGLFDMESLELSDTKLERWDDLSILDELDGPNTKELNLAMESVAGDGKGYLAPKRREVRISSLPQIPLFSQLPRQAFLDFLNAMELRRLPAGFEVLHAGDPVSCLYIIIHGEVRVEKTLIGGRVVELARMGAGQVFGEFRLLTGKGGSARVVAETDVELLEVRDEVVYEIGREFPVVWDVLWGFYFERMLNHSMATSEIFSVLSDEERALVKRHFSRRDLRAGETLFRHGDQVDRLSLIVNGMVSVEVPGIRGPELVETLGEGVFLGVSPCALNEPARATVQAVTDLVLLEMPGPIFRELIYGLPDVARAVQRVIHDRRAKVKGLSAHSHSELV